MPLDCLTEWYPVILNVYVVIFNLNTWEGFTLTTLGKDIMKVNFFPNSDPLNKFLCKTGRRSSVFLETSPDLGKSKCIAKRSWKGVFHEDMKHQNIDYKDFILFFWEWHIVLQQADQYLTLMHCSKTGDFLYGPGQINPYWIQCNSTKITTFKKHTIKYN